MSDMGMSTAERHVDTATRAAEPWVERLARMGYAAKGVVYVIIGGIALQAAFGSGDRVTDSQGALQTVLNQPLGKVLLAAVGLGLIGYALWRFVQAALDPEQQGSDGKGIAKRILFAISGLIHAGLALEAVRLVMGAGGGRSGSEGADHWTGVLLRQPFGRVLAGLVGLAILGFGIQQVYRAATSDFNKRLSLGGVASATREWIIRAARAGTAARGVVFAIMGVFLIRAALAFDASQAKGLGDALRSIQQREYGGPMLGVIAVGLMGYGIFQLVNARYRRIDPA